MSPDALSVLLRALSFVALLQATGIAVFVALFSRHLVRAGDGLRRLGAWSAAVALPLLIAQLALEAARMAGEFEGVLDMSLERILLTSPAAAAFAARVLGLVVIVGGLLRGSRMAQWVACAGSLLAAASYALMGHTAVHPQRLLLASALISHVLIAAFWLGAIPALYLATLREAGDRAGELIAAFSRVATWVVPILAVAGVVMALVLVARLSVLAQPYGWLLLGKVTAFTVLIGLAAANRSRLGPAVALGAMRGFRRSLAAEYALIVAVLAATATMTSLYSPEP
jgi:putative copper export protein